MKKKLLSLLIVICMVIGMLPVIALAADRDPFCLETWNGDSGYKVTGVTPGETAYLAQTEPDGNGYSYLIDTDDTVNYVVKVEYPEDGDPIVYFNGLDMVNPATRGFLFERDGSNGGGWVTTSNINLVIEADSYYKVDGASYYGGIEFYSTATVTISSVDGAKLTVDGGEDTGDDGASGPAAIWHRGDLVIDGAALDISCVDGYAIGAAGTITITDSEIVASTNTKAVFNKAPAIDAELGAIASASGAPADVEYDAAAWDTYKYVEIGADVTLPGIGGGEGDEEVISQDTFCLEYWAGGDGGWGGCTYVAPGGTIYLAQVDAGNGYSRLVDTDDTVNYVVKVVYPVNEAPTIYFNGVNMVNPGNKGCILFERYGTPGGGWDYYGDINLVIEKDSYLATDAEGVYGAIESYGHAKLTISSAVDPETGKLAKLTMYGEDNTDGSAGTIWHRGNLVIDGASLDVSADEGHAIGAAGTITIKDSDVIAWSEKETAFSSAPAIDDGLNAIASTIHVPDSADMEEYDEEKAGTYKYVKIGADVVLPGFGEGWTAPELTLGQAKYYLVDKNGSLTEEGADATNYKVAYIYEEKGLTIYLNGVDLVNKYPINFEGDAEVLNIVVLADSYLHASGNEYPAIRSNVDTVITSLNGAVLTVSADGPSNQFASTGNGNQVDGAIRVVGDLTLKNANLDVAFPENCAKHSGIVVDGGNLIVDGGNLNVGKGYTATINSLLQLMSDAEGNNGGMEIKNGANVVLMTEANGRPIRYDGDITISDSNFEAGSTDTTNGRRIFRDTLPTITGDCTIVGNTAVPTLDTVNFTMTAPEGTDTVDPTTLISTDYYYIKITVNEPEPEYEFTVSVTYNETLDMNFYLPAEAVVDGTVWTVKNDDVALTEDQYSLVRMDHETYGDVYRVRVTYFANQMNSVLSVTCADAESTVLATRSMSIREYGMKVLAAYGDNADLCALMVAMLDYGSLAQINMNDTAPLANKDLTDPQRAYVTNYVWPENTGSAENGTEADTENKFTISVTYNETLDVNFYIDADAIKDATTWTITNNGVALTEDQYSLVRMDHETYGDVYRVRVTYFAHEMNSVLSVTCADAEDTLIAQRSMSIREYGMKVLAAYSDNADLCALMVAMLDYGSLAQINMNEAAYLANSELTVVQREYLTNYAWSNAG